MAYKLTKTSIVRRLIDGAFIPAEPSNADYQKYLAWVAGGNTPDPVDPPTQAELDAIAQAQANDVAKAEAKADNVVQYLRDHTPAECEAYVQAQVTDLASARQMLKKFAVVLCVLAKQSLR